MTAISTANDEKFFDFCEKQTPPMNLKNPDGSLNPQGKAVMETNNCVVAAGAGSGKTTVLSYRFLRMVTEGISPERILTITFTKKATAEMKDRIYRLLQEGREAGLVSDEAMKKFSEVTISTVDSFCSEIVRRDAVHQGVPVDFTIQDNDDFEAMSNEVVDKLLSVHRNDEVVTLLHTYLSVDNIEEIFRNIAYSFLNIARPFTDKVQDDCCSAVVSKLEEWKKEILGGNILDSETEASLESSLSNVELKNKLNGILNIDLKADDIKLLRFIHAARREENLDVLCGLYKLVREYEEEIFNRKRAAGVLSFDDVMQLSIKILKENPSIRDFYKKKFDNIMIDEFQDNNDDYRKLLYLLSEKPDSHICDDEGIPVRENLCPDKIFLVGDEKQSIYRFRGADVTVFKRLCDELCSEPIELKRNWRSESKIISFCNETFPRIMKSSSSAFEARYIPLEARKDTIGLESRIVLLHPEVNVESKASSDENSGEESEEEFENREAEARGLASFIREMCKEDGAYGRFWVPDDKEKNADGSPVLRPPHYNEIGLLLKVGSHQDQFEKALTEEHIPYTVTEARSLMKGNIANDFYCALQYCVFPYDRISFASYLKSPFCSLRDDAVEEILSYKRSGGKKKKDDAPEETAEQPPVLSDTLKKSLEDAEKDIEALRSVIASGTICRALDYLWFDMGYRDYMLSKEVNRSYLGDFDNLYTIAVSYDKEGKSLVAFLDYLRPLLNSTDKIEMDAVFREKIDGVQIMTIHKSKGLAFKVVIVADMQSGERDPGGFQPHNDVKGGILSMRYAENPEDGKLENPIYKLRKKDIAAEENAEAKRVLYVAETRARYHLIFSGVITRKETEVNPTKKNPNPEPEIKTTPPFREIEDKEKRYSILTYLLQSINADEKKNNLTFSGADNAFRFEDITVKREEKKYSAADRPREFYRNIFDQAEVPVLTPGIKRITVTHPEEGNDGAKESRSVRGKKLPPVASDDIVRKRDFVTGFGTLTHKILEDRIKNRKDQIQSDVEKILSEEGQNLTDDERKCVVDSAEKLADGFMKSRLYARIKDMKLMSEKSFLLYDDSAYVDGVIDLLAVGDNEAVVIDFKTDSFMAEEKHRHQLEMYMKAVKSIYPEKKVHACVCYLRDPDSWIEIE